MQVRNPEYYFAVIQEQSISKAAEKLYISKPYLSQYIKKLEMDMGVELIDRTVSPLAPTEAGRMLYEYLERLQNMEKTLNASLHSLRHKEKNTLHIGTSSGRGAVLIPALITQLRKMYPDIDIVLHELPSDKLVELVRSGDCEVAILHRSNIEDDLIYELLVQEKILLCAPKDHPMVKQGKLLMEDGTLDLNALSGEKFILPRPNQSLAKIINNIFAKHRLQVGNSIVTTSSTTTLRLVSNGYGFAFLPETNIQDNTSFYDNVVCFPVMDPPPSFPLVVIYKKSNELFPAAREFINLTTQYYKDAYTQG